MSDSTLVYLTKLICGCRDEELLAKGIELNDYIQNELARYDAIATGTPLPPQLTNFKHQSTAVSSPKANHVSRPSSTPSALRSASLNVKRMQQYKDEEEEEEDEDEEDEDDFVQLARRWWFLTHVSLMLVITSTVLCETAAAYLFTEFDISCF